jgi:hypothetical protein
MAVETNIAKGEFFKRAAHSLVISVTDSDGVAQDMAGWDLEFVMRKRATNGDGAIVLSKTSAASEITIATSTATVAILSTDTADVFPDTYSYSLWRTDDPSDQPLAFGTLVLTAVAAQ